ncbi:hypothetical protein FHW96_004813 [Novosphingobium sp. SG751A]|uniref:hypothetical protein n=1 Tax=Novosphingobium sp. SG751A TaxID=2587000 RepID=UPI0020A6B64A|nr:hypothetical protein [Novosphingobium sp. SG751A]NOW48624.1 hypothetical protein [Novosphingobium sp. SG751A]
MAKNGVILAGFGTLILAFSGGQASAQMPTAPACASPVAPSGDYAPWANPVAVKAGNDLAGAPILPVGTAGRVELSPTPQVKYDVRPEKPGGSVSYGGILILNITKSGIYRIALGSAAWLDVIGKDGVLRSTAHGHGPDCTGVRKVVEFSLEPGRYTMQIAANGASDVTVMALPNP